MKFSRGLAALILILFTHVNLLADYLYKDEVIHNPQFRADVNTLGSELFQKTGISLKLVMLRELPNKMHIVEYEKELMKDFKEPTILLTFAELNSKVDILVSDKSLYQYFDRKQVLSPVASPIQSFIMALIYSKSFESFKEMATDYGGTILPLLADKAKKGELLGKYSGSMYNGYDDIAEQIATAKGIKLEHAAGNANKNTFFVLKIVFYGFIIYGIFLYLKRKYYIKRHKNEFE